MKHQIKVFLSFLSKLVILCGLTIILPLLKVLGGRLGYIVTGTIGHLIPTTSHLLILLEGMPSNRKPRFILLVKSRGVCNETLFSMIKKSFPRNIIFVSLPKLLNSNFETVFNQFASFTRMFDSVLIEPEKKLMWVNYSYCGVEDNADLNLRSARNYYFSNSNFFSSSSLDENHLNVSPANDPLNRKNLQRSLAKTSLRIGVVDRDSAFRGANPLRDTYFEELVELCCLLKKHNYEVIRLGSKRNYRLPKDCVDLDLPFYINNAGSNFEVEVIKSLDFAVTWKTGYQEVPLLFRTPTVMLDEFWRNDKPQTINVPPAYLNLKEKRVLLLPEMLIRFGMNFEDSIELRNSVSRIPIKSSITYSAINQLFNPTTSVSKELESLKYEYVHALQVAISFFNGKSCQDINRTKFNLNRLLFDLRSHPLPISFAFLLEYQNEVRDLGKFIVDFESKFSL